MGSDSLTTQTQSNIMKESTIYWDIQAFIVCMYVALYKGFNPDMTQSKCFTAVVSVIDYNIGEISIEYKALKSI